MAEGAAAQLIAHGVHFAAPPCIQPYIAGGALHLLHRFARIVGRKVPAQKPHTLFYGNGQLDGAALHVEHIYGVGSERAAVQPIVNGIFVRGIYGGKLRIGCYFYGKINYRPRTILKILKFIALFFRGGTGEPFVGKDVIFHAVHRNGKAAAGKNQEHCNCCGDAQKHGCNDRHRNAPAAHRHGRIGRGLFLYAEIEL